MNASVTHHIAFCSWKRVVGCSESSSVGGRRCGLILDNLTHSVGSVWLLPKHLLLRDLIFPLGIQSSLLMDTYLDELISA